MHFFWHLKHFSDPFGTNVARCCHICVFLRAGTTAAQDSGEAKEAQDSM